MDNFIYLHPYITSIEQLKSWDAEIIESNFNEKDILNDNQDQESGTAADASIHRTKRRKTTRGS